MTDTVINQLDPSADDYVELLRALIGEAKAGRLRSLTFMLANPHDPELSIIDSYGSLEHTEIACRKMVEKIAGTVEAFNPAIAKAIRDGMANLRLVH
jgi:hypothetical protein